MRAVPLPLEFTKLLERTTETLRDLRQGLFETKEVQLFRQKLLSEGVKWLKALRGTWWSRQSEQFLRFSFFIISKPLVHFYLVNI